MPCSDDEGLLDADGEIFLSRLEGSLCFPDDLPQGRAMALEGGCGCHTDADARFRPGFVDFVPLSCLCARVGTAVLG